VGFSQGLTSGSQAYFLKGMNIYIINHPGEDYTRTNEAGLRMG
jgi:hypothetical protein